MNTKLDWITVEAKYAAKYPSDVHPLVGLASGRCRTLIDTKLSYNQKEGIIRVALRWFYGCFYPLENPRGWSFETWEDNPKKHSSRLRLLTPS